MYENAQDKAGGCKTGSMHGSCVTILYFTLCLCLDLPLAEQL